MNDYFNGFLIGMLLHLHCMHIGLRPVVNTDGDGCRDDTTGCWECEGDCDEDRQCAGNLECFQRTSSSQTVPGCASTGYRNAGADWDYCYDPDREVGDFPQGIYSDNEAVGTASQGFPDDDDPAMHGICWAKKSTILPTDARFCARENEVCNCTGTAFYGSDRQLLTASAAWVSRPNSSGPAYCAHMGYSGELWEVDPAPNRQKECWCRPEQADPPAGTAAPTTLAPTTPAPTTTAPTATALTTTAPPTTAPPITGYTCQAGRGEDGRAFDNFAQIDGASCAAVCDSRLACIAFDFTADTDAVTQCRLYGENTPRLGEVNRNRQYCEATITPPPAAPAPTSAPSQDQRWHIGCGETVSGSLNDGAGVHTQNTSPSLEHWYHFRASIAGDYRLSACGSLGDSILGIYRSYQTRKIGQCNSDRFRSRGPNDGLGSCVRCGAQSLNPIVTVELNQGEYWVSIEANGPTGNLSEYVLALECAIPAATFPPSASPSTAAPTADQTDSPAVLTTVPSAPPTNDPIVAVPDTSAPTAAPSSSRDGSNMSTGGAGGGGGDSVSSTVIVVVVVVVLALVLAIGIAVIGRLRRARMESRQSAWPNGGGSAMVTNPLAEHNSMIRGSVTKRAGVTPNYGHLNRAAQGGDGPTGLPRGTYDHLNDPDREGIGGDYARPLELVPNYAVPAGDGEMIGILNEESEYAFAYAADPNASTGPNQYTPLGALGLRAPKAAEVSAATTAPNVGVYATPGLASALIDNAGLDPSLARKANIAYTLSDTGPLSLADPMHDSTSTGSFSATDTDSVGYAEAVDGCLSAVDSDSVGYAEAVDAGGSEYAEVNDEPTYTQFNAPTAASSAYAVFNTVTAPKAVAGRGIVDTLAAASSSSAYTMFNDTSISGRGGPAKQARDDDVTSSVSRSTAAVSPAASSETITIKAGIEEHFC